MKKMRRVDSSYSDSLTFESRRLGDFQFSRGTVCAIASSIILLSCFFLFLGAIGVDHAKQTNAWPATNAIVTNVVKHEHRNREYGTTYYTYTSTIQYKIDGQQFEMQFDKRLSSPQEIFYDPENPGDCVLKRGVESDGTNVAFFVAIFFGLLGCAVLTISISPKPD